MRVWNKSLRRTKRTIISWHGSYVKNCYSKNKVAIVVPEYQERQDFHCEWFEPRYNKNNTMSIRTAKAQISLGISPVWSEFSLYAWMPRLIWVSAGCTHSFGWFCRGSFLSDGFCPTCFKKGLTSVMIIVPKYCLCFIFHWYCFLCGRKRQMGPDFLICP